MLKRQKTVLAVLDEVGNALSPTQFVKLLFLLRHESPFSSDHTFYEFVPYKFGPFSFALYRELSALRRDGYISANEKSISLAAQTKSLARQKARELTASQLDTIQRVVRAGLNVSQDDLVRDIYHQFPWYALKSELIEFTPGDVPARPRAEIAVYTVGYEGKSVDGFFNGLLNAGIHAILDVRSNPVSRKYGFAKRSMSEIAAKLDIAYHHLPELGISSDHRADLSDYDSYQRLLDRYESNMLPSRGSAIKEAIELLAQEPSAFLCMEKDVNCCHRGRLAKHVAKEARLPVIHV